MSPDHSELFRALEPPAGGRERFRQRLARHAAHTNAYSRRWVFAGSTITAIAVSAVLLFGILEPAVTPDAPDPPDALVASVIQAPEFDRLLGRSSAPTDLRVAIDDKPVPVSELASTNAKIRIYEIRSN
jgi:hypothetical protein